MGALRQPQGGCQLLQQGRVLLCQLHLQCQVGSPGPEACGYLTLEQRLTWRLTQRSQGSRGGHLLPMAVSNLVYTAVGGELL